MSRVSSDLGRALLRTVHRTCRRGGRSFKRSKGIANVLRRIGLGTLPITWHLCNESSGSGPEPHTRPIVQPQSPSWPLFLRHFQPLPPPDPLHSIRSHVPARIL